MKDSCFFLLLFLFYPIYLRVWKCSWTSRLASNWAAVFPSSPSSSSPLRCTAEKGLSLFYTILLSL